MEEKKNYRKSWVDYPRVMGKVIKWNGTKGFGFIKCFEDGQSYFAHVSQCEDGRLFLGSIVEFGIGTDKQDPDKHFAMHVQTVEVPEKRC